jgi:hypothetical protein
MEAESELQKLEERLGLRPTTVVEEAPATVSIADGGASASEAEKALEELEKRLNS